MKKIKYKILKYNEDPEKWKIGDILVWNNKILEWKHASVGSDEKSMTFTKNFLINNKFLEIDYIDIKRDAEDPKVGIRFRGINCFFRSDLFRKYEKDTI